MSDLVKRLRSDVQSEDCDCERCILFREAATRIEQLEAELSALRQAQEWMPIETAPKDGTEILAWSIDGKTWHQVKWKTHENWKWLPKFEPYWSMRWNDEYHQADGHFSHWTALPAAPTAGSAK